MIVNCRYNNTYLFVALAVALSEGQAEVWWEEERANTIICSFLTSMYRRPLHQFRRNKRPLGRASIVMSEGKWIENTSSQWVRKEQRVFCAWRPVRINSSSTSISLRNLRKLKRQYYRMSLRNGSYEGSKVFSVSGSFGFAIDCRFRILYAFLFILILGWRESPSLWLL